MDTLGIQGKTENKLLCEIFCFFIRWLYFRSGAQSYIFYLFGSHNCHMVAYSHICLGPLVRHSSIVNTESHPHYTPIYVCTIGAVFWCWSGFAHMDAVSNDALNRCRAQQVTHGIIESYSSILRVKWHLQCFPVSRMSPRHNEIPGQNIFQSDSIGYYLNYNSAGSD